jgi:hypothetical protein
MLERLGHWYQRRNRRRKATWIIAFIETNQISSVLLVGVGGQPRNEWEGLIERAIGDSADWVVSSGLQEEGAIARPYVVANGLNLPFVDPSFDLVYSNAVVEHVGDGLAQQRFISEHQRVGRFWVATTPNRWFPVESHTRTLFLHRLPAWRERQTSFTRLLSRREFRRLCDHVDGAVFSRTFTGWGTASRDSPSGSQLADAPRTTSTYI